MAAAYGQLVPEYSFYLWTFPGCPVQIRLSLALVDRLRDEVEQTPQKGPCQGLLLGRASTPGTTDIDGFHTLLGAGRSASMAHAAVSLFPTGRVVGYYRSHGDGILQLEDEDCALARLAFAAPGCVFLLFQRVGQGPPNATFFFWDEGRINGDVPILEFPLDSSLLLPVCRLRATAAARGGSSSRERGGRSERGRGAQPARPEPETRGMADIGRLVLRRRIRSARIRSFPPQGERATRSLRDHR
jgi:hypothetical protein